MEYRGQDRSCSASGHGPGKGPELVIPNPKLKLMDQVREVLRVKHYAIRTVQELLGHKDVSTTQIYTHEMARPGLGVRSPLDL